MTKKSKVTLGYSGLEKNLFVEVKYFGNSLVCRVTNVDWNTRNIDCKSETNNEYRFSFDEIKNVLKR